MVGNELFHDSLELLKLISVHGLLLWSSVRIHCHGSSQLLVAFHDLLELGQVVHCDFELVFLRPFALLCLNQTCDLLDHALEVLAFLDQVHVGDLLLRLSHVRVEPPLHLGLVHSLLVLVALLVGILLELVRSGLLWLRLSLCLLLLVVHVHLGMARNHGLHASLVLHEDLLLIDSRHFTHHLLLHANRQLLAWERLHGLLDVNLLGLWLLVEPNKLGWQVLSRIHAYLIVAFLDLHPFEVACRVHNHFPELHLLLHLNVEVFLALIDHGLVLEHDEYLLLDLGNLVSYCRGGEQSSSINLTDFVQHHFHLLEGLLRQRRILHQLSAHKVVTGCLKERLLVTV